MKHHLPFLMLFLSLSSIYTTMGTCDFTQITSAQVISSSGTYCLANDIIGTLTIDADHVIFDLNGKEISGAAHGIFITSTHQCITIKNGFIKDTSQEGILVEYGSEIILKKLSIVNCGDELKPFGIRFYNSHSCIVRNCLVTDGFAGIALEATDRSFVQDCKVLNCTKIKFENVSGYSSSGLNNHFDNCAVVNLKSGEESARGFHIAVDSEVALLTNCSARGIIGEEAIGFNIIADCSTLDTCISSDLTGTNVKIFNLEGPSNLIKNCIAECSDATNLIYGFHIASDRSVIEGCHAMDLVCNASAVGYYLSGSVDENILQDCLAQRIIGTSFGRGFYGSSSVTNTLVTGCTATSCSDDGFSFSGSSNTLIHCTSFNNGNNYDVNSTTSGPRKDPGNTVTAGVNIRV